MKKEAEASINFKLLVLQHMYIFQCRVQRIFRKKIIYLYYKRNIILWIEADWNLLLLIAQWSYNANK